MIVLVVALLLFQVNLSLVHFFLKSGEFECCCFREFNLRHGLLSALTNAGVTNLTSQVSQKGGSHTIALLVTSLMICFVLPFAFSNTIAISEDF